MKFKLQPVEFMPSQLDAGIVYFSEQYGTAAHLCACGCGIKIRTPIGPTEWSIKVSRNGPSLEPSIGNWQQACQSHYFISNGSVIWAPKWSKAMIEEGRDAEQVRRTQHYEKLNVQKSIFSFSEIWNRIKTFI